MKEIPKVIVEQRENGDLVVGCPYCRRGKSKRDAVHIHGGDLGYRMSHCWNEASPHYNRQINLVTREQEMRRLVDDIWKAENDG